MNIQHDISLKPYTTFMTSALARDFTQVSSVDDIQELVNNYSLDTNRLYLLGQGSNTLFTQDFDGLVLFNTIKGIDIISEDENNITISVGAGESWHQFVMYCVERNYWGIENLVLIPGTVGAAPVQNIGAYGVEVSQVITQVTAVHLVTGQVTTFNNQDCEFGYRSSYFKQHPGEYCITSVVFTLSKTPRPHIEYGSIKSEIEKRSIESPTIKDIASIIIDIRNSKLPKVGELGTAGSFFKNPIITQDHFQKIQQQFPDMPYFVVGDNVKIPAGWTIETLGFKGLREGNVGTYNQHALVLVNYGEATGAEVWDFAEKIIHKANEVFGIKLEPEVNIVY